MLLGNLPNSKDIFTQAIKSRDNFPGAQNENEKSTLFEVLIFKRASLDRFYFVHHDIRESITWIDGRNIKYVKFKSPGTKIKISRRLSR